MPENMDLVLEKLDRINENIKDVKGISEDNRKALRGHNSTPGIVGMVSNNCDAIKDLETKSNRNDAIVGVGTVIGTVIGYIFGQK